MGKKILYGVFNVFHLIIKLNSLNKNFKKWKISTYSIFLPASGPGCIEYISSTFMSIAALGVSFVMAF